MDKSQFEINDSNNVVLVDLNESDDNYQLTEEEQYLELTGVCTVCRKQIFYDENEKNSLQKHPLLGVLICHTCVEFYYEGNFKKDDDGYEIFCRWCGDGGDVICCSSCDMVFCSECIRKNFRPKKLKDVQNDEKWGCFKCDPRQLTYLKSLCDKYFGALSLQTNIEKSENSKVNLVDEEDNFSDDDSDDEPLSKLKGVSSTQDRNEPKSKKFKSKNDESKTSPSQESIFKKNIESIKSKLQNKLMSNIEKIEKKSPKKLIEKDRSNRYSDIIDEYVQNKTPKRITYKRNRKRKDAFSNHNTVLEKNCSVNNPKKKRTDTMGVDNKKTPVRRKIKVSEEEINKGVQEYLKLKEKMMTQKLAEAGFLPKPNEILKPKRIPVNVPCKALDYTKTCVAEVKNDPINFTEEDVKDVVKGIKLFFNNKRQNVLSPGSSPITNNLIPVQLVDDVESDSIKEKKVVVHDGAQQCGQSLKKTMSTILTLPPKPVPILPKPSSNSLLKLKLPFATGQNIKVVTLPNAKRIKISPRRLANHTPVTLTPENFSNSLVTNTSNNKLLKSIGSPLKIIKMPNGKTQIINSQKNVILKMVNISNTGSGQTSSDDGFKLPENAIKFLKSKGSISPKKTLVLNREGNSTTKDVFVRTDGMEMHKVRLEQQKIPLNIVEVHGNQSHKGQEKIIKKIHITKDQLKLIPMKKANQIHLKQGTVTNMINLSADKIPDLVPFPKTNKDNSNPVEFINKSLKSALNKNTKNDANLSESHANFSDNHMNDEMDYPFADVKNEILDLPSIEALTPDIDVQELPDIVNFNDDLSNNFENKSFTDMMAKKRYVKYRVMASGIYSEIGHKLEQLGTQEINAKTQDQWMDVQKSFLKLIGDTKTSLERIQEEFEIATNIRYNSYSGSFENIENEIRSPICDETNIPNEQFNSTDTKDDDYQVIEIPSSPISIQNDIEESIQDLELVDLQEITTNIKNSQRSINKVMAEKNKIHFEDVQSNELQKNQIKNKDDLTVNKTGNRSFSSSNSKDARKQDNNPNKPVKNVGFLKVKSMAELTKF